MINKKQYTVEFLETKQIHKGVLQKKGDKLKISKDEWERLKKKNPKHISFLK